MLKPGMDANTSRIVDAWVVVGAVVGDVNIDEIDNDDATGAGAVVAVGVVLLVEIVVFGRVNIFRRLCLCFVDLLVSVSAAVVWFVGDDFFMRSALILMCCGVDGCMMNDEWVLEIICALSAPP